MPQPAEPEGRATLSLEEVAAALGISYAAAYEGTRRQEIPSLRIGRRIHVPASWVRQLTGEPEDVSQVTTALEVAQALAQACDALGAAQRAVAAVLEAVSGPRADAGQTARPRSGRRVPLTSHDGAGGA